MSESDDEQDYEDEQNSDVEDSDIEGSDQEDEDVEEDVENEEGENADDGDINEEELEKKSTKDSKSKKKEKKLKEKKVKKTKKTKTKQKDYKEIIEESEEYVSKKVQVIHTTYMQDLAKRLGIPLTENKLVPMKVQRKVLDVDIDAMGRIKSPIKTLVSKKDPKETVKEVEIDRPVRREIEVIPKQLPIANPYKKKLTVGKYVRVNLENSTIEGVIIEFNETSITVSDYKNKQMYSVNYDEDIKIIKPPEKEEKEKKEEVTVWDAYTLPVPDALREIVVKLYEAALENIIPVTNQGKRNEHVSPIDWALLNSEFQKWSDYYSFEFTKWFNAQNYDTVRKTIDTDKLRKIAEEQHKKQTDITEIISSLNSLFNDNDFMSHTDSEIIDELKNKTEISLLDAMIVEQLERARYIRKNENITEYKLANILSEIIDEYLSKNDNSDAHFKSLLNKEVLLKLDNMEVHEIDTKTFNAQYKQILQQKYDEYVNIYKREKEKAERKVDKESLDIEQDVKIVDEIKKLEQLAYASHGELVYDYLLAISLPLIFMDSLLASYAKMFKAKLSVGAYPISALMSANLAHYLPEIAMNKKMTVEDWDYVSNIISRVLITKVNNIISLYYGKLNPTMKVRSYDVAPALMSSIKRLVVDPREICKEDTNSGYMHMVRDGKYVYEQTRRGRERKLEPIPESELVICYDDGKFTCHTIKEVMISIYKGDFLNPYLKKKYPKSFIDKMRDRYSHLLRDDVLIEPEEPPIEKVEQVIQKKVPTKIIRKTKRKRPIPAGTKKKEVINITKMALVGPIFNVFTLFDEEINFDTKDGIRSVPITTDVMLKSVNVVVYGFDVTDPKLESLKTIKTVKNKRIYVVGINANKVPGKNLVITTTKVSKLIPSAKGIFYSNGGTEEEIKDSLLDILVDMEGVTVD